MTDKEIVARMFDDVDACMAGLRRDLPRICANGMMQILKAENEYMRKSMKNK